MKLPPELPKCAAYRRFRVRPELPKETRDKVKINAPKIYHMNKEIRSKADIAGSLVYESYSFSQNGGIVRYSRDGHTYTNSGRRSAGENENWKYVRHKWIKDKAWTEDSSSN